MNDEEVKHLQQSYYNLHEEYYKLKSMVFQSIDNTNKAIELYEIYQDRNEKAINYIESQCREEDGFLVGYGDDLDPQTLLNILQGSEKDDK